MNKTLKNILLWLTSAFMFLCVIVGVAFAPKTASAEDTVDWQTGSVFEMDDGASLKLGNVGGLRFIARMDKTVYDFVMANDDAEFGFIIAPKNLMLAANGDYLNMSLKIGGAADKDKIYADGDYYLANGCITDVKLANLTRSFAAVAYISYNGEVRYTEYNDLARNNLYDSVNAAVLSGDYPELFTERAGGYVQVVGEDEGWYGSEEFPIVVETDGEYDKLVEVVNETASVDFSNYHVVVKNDAATNKVFANTAPTIIDAAVDELNKLIQALPDEIEMPDAIGQVGRVREAEKKYNALSDTKKVQVNDYAKVESLLTAIKGYDRVYKNDADDGTVIPSHVPNYTSTVGGSATTRTDDVYGNVLTVTSAADGKAALHFQNFPSIEKYAKIYFYARILDISCDIYLSDGITNDGWGNGWNNNWSLDGYWCNANTWKLVEIDLTKTYLDNEGNTKYYKDMFETDFALGFRAQVNEEKVNGFTFEISDFYGIVTELATAESGLSFGSITDAGTHENYGQIYNLTQAWDSANDLGSIGAGQLKAALADGHNTLKFWIYNPVASEVNLYGSCAGHEWAREALATLAPNAWTEVTIGPALIEASQHDSNDLCICVKDSSDTGVAKTAGWQISKIRSCYEAQGRMTATLDFGTKTDTGETNEYGTVYNISRGVWYVENNVNNTMGDFGAGALANALLEGYEYFYFWMYNPTDTVYSFHIAGGNTWTDSADSYSLAAKAWTKVTISAADIEMTKAAGTWYVYILGGDGAGAAKDGWQISTIYAGPDKVSSVAYEYYDHADVKEVLALINAIPETVTLSDKAAVEAARAAYNKLTVEAQAMVSNYSKLTAAETTIADLENANEVIALIDAINANDPDEATVEAARAAYNELSDAAKALVTNLAKLEAYEEALEKQQGIDKVNTMIANLPDSVVMPDNLVFVPRIEAAQAAYNALPEEDKSSVENYAKLRSLVSSIKGYEIVYTPAVGGVQAIPALVHAAEGTTVSGSFVMDETYGATFVSTANEGGKAAIQFVNFPSVADYDKIYFYARSSVAGSLYMAEDTENGGWGTNWKNNSGSATNYSIGTDWTLMSLDVSTGIISGSWMMSVWGTGINNTTLEVAAIIGVKSTLGSKTSLTFGNIADSGTVNGYGTVYNLTQGWSSNTDFGTFNAGALRAALNEGHDSLRFYIYNPNASDVVFYVSENETWIETELATLTANAWTEVVLNPEIITSNDSYLTWICVRSGANMSGWQISAIYSYSTTEVAQDAIEKVQNQINALDTSSIDEAAVTAARKAYEALSESEKAIVVIDNLITCETALYGDVENASFIVDGASDYKIYYEKDSKAAATFMQTRLTEATGVELSLVKGLSSNVTKYRYAIVLGYESLYAQLGLSVPTEEEIGRAGYQIVKLGRAVFIFAYSADGYRMGTLEFLSQTVGYDMIAEDCIVYDASKAETLPAFNTAEALSFDYRQKQTALTDDEVYGMGLQAHDDIWIHSPEGWDMHNTLHYLPTATYQSAHPTWYYTYTDSVNVSRTQICPTAGGSSTEFNAMVEAIAENMMVQINAYPERENISFSIMDTGDGDDCTCERCTLYDTLYGEGGFAAAWIDLMNAVNAKIRETLPADRVLNIAFLAYRGTEKAPANIDANGNVTLMKRYEINDDGTYTQTSEDLKCDEGVTVWLAPINGYFAENFNHADNAETLATIKKWCAISNSVYLWMYGTNFKFYMYPYNTWQASAENYKILKDLGVKAAWSQSNETEATAFTDLKAYIDSKFMADVNADYEAVLNTYFTGYFGAGATKMREMFDTIVAKCEAIEETYDGLGRGIYDEIESYEEGWLIKTTKYYWTQDEANALIALCDEAKAAIDADTTLTDAQKTAFKNTITKESLFPRYVLCTAYASKYSSSTKKSMRQAFKADADALGFTLYREADGDLSKLYSDWGI